MAGVVPSSFPAASTLIRNRDGAVGLSMFLASWGSPFGPAYRRLPWAPGADVSDAFGVPIFAGRDAERCASRSHGSPFEPYSHNMAGTLVYSFVIGSVGATLFVLVDKYERDGMVGSILKVLILAVGGVAILHKLGPSVFGIGLF